MTTTASAIEARGLVRRFGDKEAVAGIDITVASGEIFGFLGPNGAGKSTTVRMLTTLLSPSDGTASVAGFNIDTEADDVRLRIGVALQDAALDPKQTGRELLDMQGRLYGLPKDVRLRRVDELLQLVNIGGSIDDRIATYSGGMKRRLDLAAALVHQPEVLFLDEPTTGLDPTSRAAVWEEVRYLNEQLGITIFLTTQYLEEADELADRVGIIARGKIVAEGTPDELKRSIGADVIIAKVGSGDGSRAAQVLAALSDLDSVEVSGDQLVIATAHGASAISPVAVTLANNSIKVSELTLRTPTLDDVFLHTTGSRMDANEEEAVTA
ncbi:MAG: ATP-binding cassette domain-containing protein [Actinobacteria bacterium]|nr:ATP-binding cassette domain-containing protein [Actinomycetota bacterium]